MKVLSSIIQYIKDEPAVVITQAGTVLNAIALLGLRLPPDKVFAVNLLVGALVSAIVRKNVTPVSKLEGKD